jgi:hypothetical protein
MPVYQLIKKFMSLPFLFAESGHGKMLQTTAPPVHYSHALIPL